ncbi:MAG TPA: hypothetical protein VLA40_11940 [Rheinheimera sp.]|nr:hypothetical protein [Rheinheimera sp.]
MSLKKQPERLDYKKRMLGICVTRRTWEIAIQQVWKCDQKTAKAEFDRALDAGEFERAKAGLVKDVEAYKLKI